MENEKEQFPSGAFVRKSLCDRALRLFFLFDGYLMNERPAASSHAFPKTVCDSYRSIDDPQTDWRGVDESQILSFKKQPKTGIR